MKGISLLRISKILLEYASLVAMAAVFVLFAIVFSNYPADKSNVFMLFGRGFTVEKISLFVLFIICGGINATLFIVSRFPSLYKYPFKITAENIEVQYHIAKIMLSIIQILVSCFFWILFMEIRAHTLSGAFAPLDALLFISILAAITISVYLLLAYKFK
jgi:hypothetical protein